MNQVTHTRRTAIRNAKRTTISSLILTSALLLTATGCDEVVGVTHAPNATAVGMQKADARAALSMNHNETLLSEADQSRDQNPSRDR